MILADFAMLQMHEAVRGETASQLAKLTGMLADIIRGYQIVAKLKPTPSSNPGGPVLA